jgi:hypothetical protein
MHTNLLKRPLVFTLATFGIITGVAAGFVIPQITTPASNSIVLPTAHISTSSTAASPACTAKSIRLGLNPSTSAVGHTYFNLILINTGSVLCTLNGYPQLSVLDSSAQTLGTMAAYLPATPANIALDAGSIAHAVIDFRPSPTGTCSVPGVSLKVMLPNVASPLAVTTNQASCQGWTVGPILGGTGQ